MITLTNFFFILSQTQTFRKYLSPMRSKAYISENCEHWIICILFAKNSIILISNISITRMEFRISGQRPESLKKDTSYEVLPKNALK